MGREALDLSLPHAYPFVMLDRLLDLHPGASALAVKNLTRDDPLVDADGCLPPVLLAETLAQAAGVVAFAEDLVPRPWFLVPGSGRADIDSDAPHETRTPEPGTRHSQPGSVDQEPRTTDQEPETRDHVSGTRTGPPVALARINRFRCRASVSAGDQLLVSVRVRKIFSGSAMVRGVIRVNGRIRAAGEVVLQRLASSANSANTE